MESGMRLAQRFVESAQVTQDVVRERVSLMEHAERARILRSPGAFGIHEDVLIEVRVFVAAAVDGDEPREMTRDRDLLIAYVGGLGAKTDAHGLIEAIQHAIQYAIVVFALGSNELMV